MAAGMTDEELMLERRKLAQELERLNKRAEQLGLAPSGQKPKRERAPDGGPTSQGHRFLKTQLRQLIRVRMINLPGTPERLIRADAFDPDEHEKLVVPRTRVQLDDEDSSPEAKAAADFTAKVEKARAAFGKETREELVTFSIGALRDMAEVTLLAKVPEKKADLVDAILKVREDHG